MSFCSSLASMIAVPVPLPFWNPCKTSCNTIELRSRVFTIDVQTFQMVSTRPMHIYSPTLFCIRNIVVHIKASGMYLSQNATCMTLTTLSHVSVSGSFYLVAARNHDLRSSAFIPNGPPALPNRSFLTDAVISRTSGVPSAILNGCTRIGSVSPLGGNCL